MQEIASLDEWRTARSGSSTRCVACGSEWFRLVSHDDRPPAITLGEDRTITGYAGTPVCSECGTAAV